MFARPDPRRSLLIRINPPTEEMLLSSGSLLLLFRQRRDRYTIPWQKHVRISSHLLERSICRMMPDRLPKVSLSLAINEMHYTLLYNALWPTGHRDYEPFEESEELTLYVAIMYLLQFLLYYFANLRNGTRSIFSYPNAY